MARLSREELIALMKAENVDRIWSWSKWNSFHTSPYEYCLKYLMKRKEDRTDCIYTTTGGIAHDILEKYYSGEIGYENMKDLFSDGWMTAYDIAEMKFDRNSDEKNKQIAEKYYQNLLHFFSNHTTLEHKPMIEQFVKAKIGDNLFQGYIDICFKDDEGNYNILDWKTSSIYKGEKAKNECGQLVVYAIGLNQQGIPMDKIKICWNFIKYVSIQYEQANGAIKTREVERAKIGESLQANAKTWLKKLGYADELDDYLKLLLDTNSIECLPEDVRAKYVIKDCLVYVPITQELLDKWTTDIVNVINDIEAREKDYNELKAEGLDDIACSKAFWDTDESVQAQSYYFATLCGYSPNLHLPYKAYLDRLEAAQKGADMFNGVGETKNTPVNTTDKVICNKNDGEDDLSWLNDI